MKILKWFLAVIVLIIIVILAGPKVESPVIDKKLPAISEDLHTIEAEIVERERGNDKIKPNNEARIIWADSAYMKTPYSIVYLHGFSASQEEGAPLHTEIAERYGCNLYLPRLHGHGLNEEEPMLSFTAEGLINSAKEAIAVGEAIGEKVILVATSTGGTLALYLAGNDPSIAGLVLYSPNIEIYDANSWLLDEPWGLQLARLVKGGEYHSWEIEPERAPYWTSKYRLEALTHLEELVDVTMTPETFQEVKRPVFLGYYYKNDSLQDNTVSVPAMLDMYEQLGTPENMKRKIAFENVGHHVLASYLTSSDLASVRMETFRFLEEVLELQPIEK